jgi:dihydrolipoamide dehydrogenase
VLAKQVIVATGSKARHLPNLPVDQKIVMDNEGALNQESVPKKLAIIGAGVIGLEMGSVWRRVGSEVTILEAMPDFLAAADQDVAKEALKLFTKQGLNIQMGVKIGDIKATKKSVSIAYTDKDGKEQKLDADRLIVSIGRVPNTDGLNAEALASSWMPVVSSMLMVTARPTCRAFGRSATWCAARCWHKAHEEGVMVAELMAGQAGHCNFDTIPWVIYTSPEIAWVGKTEQQLKAEGVAYKAGKVPFLANGRALGMGDPSGFVKMLACKETDRILGVHIIGANASEMIAEAVVRWNSVALPKIWPASATHPTLSERA